MCTCLQLLEVARRGHQTPGVGGGSHVPNILELNPIFLKDKRMLLNHRAKSPGLDVFYLKDETGSPVAKQFVDPAVIHEPSSAQPKGIQVPKATKVGESLQKIKTESTKGYNSSAPSPL